MTILVINNKGQYNHRIQRSLQYLKIPTELVPNTLSIEEIEAKNPIGLILGGGPSIEGAGNSEEYIKHFDIPILGICLGHQLIAKAYGGQIDTSNTESYAKVEINIVNDENLFSGLAPKMEVWSSHKDEVKSIPDDFEILANSNLCDVESFKHTEKDVYGIQFHPEVHHTPKGSTIFENFYEICKKKGVIMIDNPEDLKEKALANKPGLRRQYVNIPVGDEEYGFRISGIGAKAIKLEKYVKYDEIFEALEAGNENGLEAMVKQIIEDYEEENEEEAE